MRLNYSLFLEKDTNIETFVSSGSFRKLPYVQQIINYYFVYSKSIRGSIKHNLFKNTLPPVNILDKITNREILKSLPSSLRNKKAFINHKKIIVKTRDNVRIKMYDIIGKKLCFIDNPSCRTFIIGPVSTSNVDFVQNINNITVFEQLEQFYNRTLKDRQEILTIAPTLKVKLPEFTKDINGPNFNTIMNMPGLIGLDDFTNNIGEDFVSGLGTNNKINCDTVKLYRLIIAYACYRNKNEIKTNPENGKNLMKCKINTDSLMYNFNNSQGTTPCQFDNLLLIIIFFLDLYNEKTTFTVLNNMASGPSQLPYSLNSELPRDGLFNRITKQQLLDLLPNEYSFLKTETEYNSKIDKLYDIRGITPRPGDNIMNFIPSKSSALMLSMIGKKLEYKLADTLYLFTQIIKELDYPHLLWRYYNTDSAEERIAFKNNYIKFIPDDRINNEIDTNPPEKIATFINLINNSNNTDDIKKEFMNLSNDKYKNKYCSSDKVISQLYILLSSLYNKSPPNTLCTQPFTNIIEHFSLDKMKTFGIITIVSLIVLIILIIVLFILLKQ